MKLCYGSPKFVSLNFTQKIITSSLSNYLPSLFLLLPPKEADWIKAGGRILLHDAGLLSLECVEVLPVVQFPICRAGIYSIFLLHWLRGIDSTGL